MGDDRLERQRRCAAGPLAAVERDAAAHGVERVLRKVTRARRVANVLETWLDLKCGQGLGESLELQASHRGVGVRTREMSPCACQPEAGRLVDEAGQRRR